MIEGPKEEELAEWLGADICEELFGKPEDPPNTLLWLANSFCSGITRFTSFFVDDSQPETTKNSKKIN